MTENEVKELKKRYEEYLDSISITQLRVLGRNIGVPASTVPNKAPLIEKIVGVLSGEIAPASPNKRGKPPKNNHLDPEISEKISGIEARFISERKGAVKESVDTLDFAARMQAVKDNPFMFEVNDPNIQEPESKGVREIYRGQLETLGGVPMLLPLDFSDTKEKIIMPVELIREHDLYEGDVVSCYAEKHSKHLVAVEVLSVNELVCNTFRRVSFDECESCYPCRRMHFYDGEKFSSLTAKYLEWLIPIGKGQRGLVVAPPKSGKSTLLLEMARAAKSLNGSMQVFVLLVDQSPENVGKFRKAIGADNLVSTTYEDDPERQVFAADFILRRAKRSAECGNEVLLIVDSLNALASAYNDTDASAGGKVFAGGLESKTVQYLKRYFGTARCFEKGGSVAIVGTLSTQTGNPADETLLSHLADVGNLEIALNSALARRRVYPAIDLANTQGKESTALMDAREAALDGIVRGEYLPKFGAEALLETISKANSFDELEASLLRQLEK